MKIIAISILACFFAGCCGSTKTESSSSNNTTVSTPTDKPASTPRAVVSQPHTEEVKEVVTLPDTLAEAITASKSTMADSTNDIDKGAIQLAKFWNEQKYPWAQLLAIPETKRSLVHKDSDSERGKRFCTSGIIVQIAKIANGFFDGLMMNDASEISSFLSVGSTGDLVKRDPARFCGIVTGLHTYSNSGGGTTHSMRLVGMFDLPENKKVVKK